MKKILFVLLTPFFLSAPLNSHATTNREIQLLKQLVLVNSGSRNISGVNQVQRLVEKELKRIGFATQIIQNPTGREKTGDLLIGTLSGQDPRYVTLLTHADTVFEPDSGFKGFSISSDGETATGPGVIDDKGGIVVALSGLERFLSTNKKPKFSLRVVVSPSEEVGHSGFYDEYIKISRESLIILGFEPSLEDGSIIESRRGNRWYHIQVTGREAHAGRAHDEGVNACHELAIKLDQIQRLTNYKKGLTASIGRMEGGKDKFNIVCGSAEAKVDIRASDLKTFNEAHQKIEKILKKSEVHSYKDHTPSKIEYSIADLSPPFSAVAVSQPYLEFYRKTIENIEGRPVRSGQSGGAADTNYMSRKGLIILDGLGPRGSGFHTKEETIDLPSIKSRAEALSHFLSYLIEVSH